MPINNQKELSPTNLAAVPEIPAWILEMLPEGPRRALFNVGDQQMHVMEFGNPEGFPVLMQHGNPTWGFLYRRIIAEFPDSPFRFIVPDLIGLGFSSKPKKELHTLANHGKWLGELIDQLQLKKLIFVGQDWGGPIGLRALADRPELLKGLVILNTAFSPLKTHGSISSFHALVNRPLISDFLFRILQYPVKNLHQVQGDKKSISGAIAKAYLYPIDGLKKNGAALILARMVPASPEHPSNKELAITDAFARSFKGPAAIVWGKNDPVLGRRLPKITEILPHAALTLTSAGHFIQEEEPKLIAEALQGVYNQL